ncbi:MAG: hypothetical protein K0R22_1702 [Sporomusa sp.]|jgi:4-oxalomesaconate hydratase|nr:hypothetical protein [Sporomusa sp.]MDF2875019.1 hypothetical protein [Sporomusa sp.]
MIQTEGKSMVVVCAHAGDFVWRAGGAIALHKHKYGYRVAVVCLSFGERGEANSAYQKEGANVETVRALQRAEASAAAEILGAEIHFLDGQDYLLKPTPEMLEKLVDIYRELQPEFILTHPPVDPSNWDHVETHRFALEARMVAQAQGRPGGKIIGAPQVYSFEPHQTEICNFIPNTFLDITEVWEIKWQAMQCMSAKPAMWKYYKNMAEQRGSVAMRRRLQGGSALAEAYQKNFPSTVKEL